MNLPLFHDPLQGTVTVDAPVRDPRIGRDAAFSRNAQSRSTQPRPTTARAPRTEHRTPVPTRSARQRKVAEDLQALMARTANSH